MRGGLPPFTPARRRGVEILDDPTVPDAIRLPAMADVARANRFFGGTRALLTGLREALPTLPTRTTLIDVGTGTGDIVPQAQRVFATKGLTITAFGVDVSECVACAARSRLAAAIVADGMHLPFASDSADVVVCSQVLHHFGDADARTLIAELHRVSRDWVIIADLRRSWLAAGGFYVASRLLDFHPVTRADGIASVFRGFVPSELGALIRNVTGIVPHVRTGTFWRITATWSKRRSNGHRA